MLQAKWLSLRDEMKQKMGFFLSVILIFPLSPFGAIQKYSLLLNDKPSFLCKRDNEIRFLEIQNHGFDNLLDSCKSDMLFFHIL